MDDSLENGELILYQTDDGQVKLDVRLYDESIWMSQLMMAELFQTTKQNIGQHIQNIFDEGELTSEATVKKFFTVQTEGSRQVRRSIEFYNLDMIISVGYRVKSLTATRFRIWATERLREYIVKGFTMDDERLKDPPVKGSSVRDYFSEMLERIRDIRASEKRVYLRVREIFAMAADYEPSDKETATFFSVIRTSSTMRPQGKQRRNLSSPARIIRNRIWGLHHGKVTSRENPM